MISVCAGPAEQAAQMIATSMREGGKLMLCGNGGSAGDSQHLAAEFVATLDHTKTRPSLPALSLTTDTSFLTAYANDFGFDKVFERQVQALAVPGDTLIGISTSGKSSNVINALKLANNLDCRTIGFSGNNGGNFNSICDVNLIANSTDTPRIQELHILIGHIICHLIDQAF